MILNKRGEWNGVKFSRIRLESVEEDSEKDPEIEVELQGRDERKRKSEGRKNWKKTEVQKRKVTGSDLDRDSDKQDEEQEAQDSKKRRLDCKGLKGKDTNLVDIVVVEAEQVVQEADDEQQDELPATEDPSRTRTTRN